MIRNLNVVFILATVLVSSCSSSQVFTPTATGLKNTATATQSPQTTISVPASTLIPVEQNKCLAMETTPLVDFMLDGRIVLGNFEDQIMYTLSTGDENPQPLLGKDPSWDPGNSHISPNGQWLVSSILSDDGLTYTTLKVKSLNGDQVWEIPYQTSWYFERGWINNEQIEIFKSETEKMTTSPFTGAIIINPFTGDKALDIDFGAKKLILRSSTTPYFDPTLTRTIYLRDKIVPESGEALIESVVIAEISSGKELWKQEDLGANLLTAAWSTDGKQVAYQEYERLTVVIPDVGEDKILEKNGLNFDVTVPPVWSSDGHYVAVKTYDSLGIYDPISDIFTDYCLHDDIRNFSWSPNGRQLAVGGWSPDGLSYILVINVDTKTAVNFKGGDFYILGWTLK